MATTKMNGVQLAYELHGEGAVPLVLVHGSWDSRHAWDAVVPGLAQSYRVLSYDRRGHSESERPAGQGSIQEDVADLAGLIEHLGLAPAWVAGNSFGASIALRLAGMYSTLVRGVIGHEPPLLSLLAEDPATVPLLKEVTEKFGSVTQRLAAGDHAGAAKEFIDTVALGPGAWDYLPSPAQETCIHNAPTFLDETRDPEAVGMDLDAMKLFPRPLLLSTGDQSPPMFRTVIAKLSVLLPRAEVVTLHGAGHIPHATHPDAYLRTVSTFIHKHAGSARVED
jgi:pimeloyl-ACP methyl ester carboxylesterase